MLFTPNDGNRPRTRRASTPPGKKEFQLMYRGRSGVSPGKYSVLIAKTIEPPALKASEEFKDNPMLAGMAHQQVLISSRREGPGSKRRPWSTSPTRSIARSPLGRSVRFRPQSSRPSKPLIPEASPPLCKVIEPT